jgi:hypothetical protein
MLSAVIIIVGGWLALNAALFAALLLRWPWPRLFRFRVMEGKEGRSQHSHQAEPFIDQAPEHEIKRERAKAQPVPSVARR